MPGGISPWISTPAGFVFLWLGAEALVNGASRIAHRLGISKVVIGLTLVAFGTSLPELLVCVTAAFRGTPDIALGNVVGSNIANVGLIIGVAAVIAPLVAGRPLRARDLPWAIVAALLVGAFALTGQFGRLAGLLMLALFTGYMVHLFRTETNGPAAQRTREPDPPAGGVALEALMAVAGFAMLLIGAPLLVDGATAVARALGISELVIGLTMIAVGTSLPELATAVVASARRHPELILGNVVGSNIFNLLLVLAMTSVVFPVPVGAVALRQDIPVMIGFSLVLLAVCLGGRRVSRVEGGALLTLYLAYTAWLFMRG
jgi:cation:H+ antiporter